MAAAILAVCGPPAAAQFDRFLDDKHEPVVKFSAGPWFTSAMGRWQTSFPICSNQPKSVCGFGSTLEFQDSFDRMYLWTAEARVHPRLSVEVEYADSAQISGNGRDHDWLDGPNTIFTLNNGHVYNSPNQTDFSLSQNTLSGRSTYFSVNLFGRLGKWRPNEDFLIYENVDLSLGFTWYDDRYRMKSLVQLISNNDMASFDGGVNPPAPGNYANLDSTFHFRWYGPKLGFREETGILKHLSAVGYFAGSPFMRYYGEGFWNLRTDFQNGPPSFTQTATASMVEGRLTVVYSPFPFLSLEGGYMLVYMHTRPGTMYAYERSGARQGQDLDSAWSERKGLMVDLALKF